MSRTALFRTIRRLLQTAYSAERSRVDAERLWTRRDALRASAALAAVPLIGSTAACGGDDDPPPPPPAETAKVAIVGAGMAGLHCAYRLKKSNVLAKIYEASDRVGGRMFTARGMLEGGQIAELGGELIDTGHVTMQMLAGELGLTLDDLFANEPQGLRRDTFYFGGRVLNDMEIVDAFRPVAMEMASTVTAAEADDTLFEMIDNMSITEWLMSLPGDNALIRSILENAYTGEYGREADEQSIFNLLYLIDYEEVDPFRIYGDSDERFHLHEGSDSIPTRLAAEVMDQIETGTKLVALAKNASGKYVLTLERGSSRTDVEYEQVVLTLPFTLLREVDLTNAELPADKLEVIQELGYGTNAKLMGQYTSKPWLSMSNASGASFSDLSPQTTWGTSRGQAGDQGILTVFLGGDAGLAANAGTPEERYTSHLGAVDTIFPGAQAAYRSGSALRMHWPSAPFAKASYGCYTVGQWAYYELEGRSEGGIHFAGEHCSLEFQGYMEGAAETGALAAMNVLNTAGLRATRSTRRGLVARPMGPRMKHMLRRRRRAQGF
jgi:monoamine oxidase